MKSVYEICFSLIFFSFTITLGMEELVIKNFFYIKFVLVC